MYFPQDYDVISIDQDNSVAISVRTEDNLITVNIMSEFMVKDKQANHGIDGACALTRGRSDVTSYNIEISQLDLLLFYDLDALAVHMSLSRVSCHAVPREKPPGSVTSRESVVFSVDDIQLDNCLRDQTYDFGVVLFTDKAIRSPQSDSKPFLRINASFNKSRDKQCLDKTRRTINEFRFEMGKIHVHLEDVFLYRMLGVVACYISRVTPHAATHASPHSDDVTSERETSAEVPITVERLMAELYEPLSAELFCISEIEIGMENCKIILWSLLNPNKTSIYINRTRIARRAIARAGGGSRRPNRPAWSNNKIIVENNEESLFVTLNSSLASFLVNITQSQRYLEKSSFESVK